VCEVDRPVAPLVHRRRAGGGDQPDNAVAGHREERGCAHPPKPVHVATSFRDWQTRTPSASEQPVYGSYSVVTTRVRSLAVPHRHPGLSVSVADQVAAGLSSCGHASR
jgi:hypothetical protein